jgi:hypothetical protein
MPKFRILPAASANGIMISLNSSIRNSRSRGQVGQAVVSPETWDGVGEPPIGWTVPCGTLIESGGSRIAIIATDTFAAGHSEFNVATNELPFDWSELVNESILRVSRNK